MKNIHAAIEELKAKRTIIDTAIRSLEAVAANHPHPVEAEKWVKVKPMQKPKQKITTGFKRDKHSVAAYHKLLKQFAQARKDGMGYDAIKKKFKTNNYAMTKAWKLYGGPIKTHTRSIPDEIDVEALNAA